MIEQNTASIVIIGVVALRCRCRHRCSKLLIFIVFNAVNAAVNILHEIRVNNSRNRILVCERQHRAQRQY